MQVINEVGNVHDRIVQMVDYFCKGNKAAFGRATNIQSGVLAGLIGGRKNKPSFEVLQKILTGYPSVNPTWLLFGRGPMLQDNTNSLSSSTPDITRINAANSDDVQRSAIQAVEEYMNSPDWKDWLKNMMDESYKRHISEHEALRKIYVVAKKYPYGPESQLSVRLGITEEEVRQLILDGKIQASDLGKQGFRVREQAVRDFLSQQ